VDVPFTITDAMEGGWLSCFERWETWGWVNTYATISNGVWSSIHNYQLAVGVQGRGFQNKQTHNHP
jgi:hypothetical protein